MYNPKSTTLEFELVSQKLIQSSLEQPQLLTIAASFCTCDETSLEKAHHTQIIMHHDIIGSRRITAIRTVGLTKDTRIPSFMVQMEVNKNKINDQVL